METEGKLSISTPHTAVSAYAAGNATAYHTNTRQACSVKVS